MTKAVASEGAGPEVVFLFEAGHPQTRMLHDALAPLGLRVRHVAPTLGASNEGLFAGVDLAVLSLSPDGLALQLAAHLRHELALSTPAFLFLTLGQPSVAQIERAYALGTADVLTEPLAVAPLRARVAAIVHAARRGRKESGAHRVARPLAKVTETHDHDVLSVAAHELRNPLTALRLALATLEHPISRNEALATVRLCARQVDRLRRLTNTLVEAALLDQERPLEVSEEIDVASVTTALCEDLRLEIEGAGAHLEIDLVPARACIDVTEFEQILTNLILNALRHADTETIRVKLRTTGRCLRLEVSDQGGGIGVADQERIFEAGERASTSSVRGSGLGLWITRSLVRAQGGSITCASERGRGTTFVVELPVMAPQSRPGPEELLA